MENEKYFVIIRGVQTGIFHGTWSDVKDYVIGFSDAKYKSFTTYDEAHYYLETGKDASDKINDNVETKIESMGENDLIAFTDGSYKPGTDKCGAGIVMINKISGVKVVTPFCRSITDEKYLSMHNVGGEILAVTTIINWALQRNYSRLTIYYDLQDLEQWVKSPDTAKNDVTQAFVDLVNQAEKKINIEFSKIKSHTGVAYNEQADKEAKKALEG